MRKGDYIGTYTGKQLWLLDPKPEDICIEDIAHALSQICRFTGHTNRFYSIAHHSINVEMYLYEQGYNDLAAFYGLIHDAAEAYVGDVSRPLKRLLTGFEEIETGVQKAIYQHFGVSEPSTEIKRAVKEADDYILAVEARKFMKNTENWGLAETGDYDLFCVGGSVFIKRQWKERVKWILGEIRDVK